MTATFPLPREVRETTILTGDGVTTQWGPFDFKVFDTADIEVWTRAAGGTPFAKSADVTVAKTTADALAHFTVTFGTAPAADTWFIVVSRRTHERDTDATRDGSIDSRELEKELSKQGTVIQELRRDLGRVVRADYDRPNGATIATLPEGHFFKSDANGDLVDGGDADDIIDAQGHAATAAAEREAIQTLRDEVEGLRDEAAGFAAQAFNEFLEDNFPGDGSTTAFTLSVAPGSARNTFVWVDSVLQPPASYSVSGTTLSFLTPPPAPVSGTVNNIHVRYGSAIEVNTPGAGTVGSAALNAGEAASIRSVLDVLSASEVAAQVAFSGGVPTGQIGFFDRSTAPPGWVKAAGETVGNASSGATERADADTENLFALIWNEFDNTARPIEDSGGTPTTRGASAAADFAAGKRLPVADARGRAVRALDDGAGIDTGRALGSVQDDALQDHTHFETVRASSSGSETGDGFINGSVGSTAGGGMASGRIATETRMTNYAALACVKL